ncbi:Adenylate cyclase [Carbonactinospora thermoautotrophica]|uniref:Adenylate cyclase n=1 Tax=Carbonactinospora thermoautotrophica TaxID=1469144 RepID=A0A132MVL8_9ACTN|nr:class IV adenylate cyclase [Carbonactinospora thermoautotrophica]KWX01750.1 Adenylate cyclase [Carbonactinospora thermoautotrophica]
MIEAELKARVKDPERVRQRLRERSTEEVSVYRDTYYDRPDGELAQGDRELRVRTIETAHGARTILTFKDAAVDVDSGSKPEYETTVGQPDMLAAILRALGFAPVIAFEKHCANYAFAAHGRNLRATLVRVPELDGDFLEVETLVDDPADVPPALDAIRKALADLGIGEDDLTTEKYTDGVARRRAQAEVGQ